LYTCDTDISNIALEPVQGIQTKMQKKMARVKARLARDRYKQAILAGEIQVSGLFETDLDLIEIRAPFKSAFFERFAQGYAHYEKGTWVEAKSIFETIPDVKGSEDFPAKNLLSVMEEHNFKAPADWQGYRALTEK